MNGATSYRKAVERQRKAHEALVATENEWAIATEWKERLLCREKVERLRIELQDCIAEVAQAHAAYWIGRAAELRPALAELAQAAAAFDAMHRAAGSLVREPWLQEVRAGLANPLQIDLAGDGVPIVPELSDAFDLGVDQGNEMQRHQKAEKEIARGRKWI